MELGAPADETPRLSAVVGRGQDAPGMGHVAPLRLMGTRLGFLGRSTLDRANERSFLYLLDKA